MEKKHRVRGTSDHWELILEYSEKHPEIITNKFASHLQGKEANIKLWGEMCSALNALGHGSKSVDSWKKTIIDWKSNTKQKASKINKHQTQTGGGPALNLALTNLEERLLQIMGRTATYGDNTTSEKGLKRQAPAENNKENTLEVPLLPLENILVEERHGLIDDHDYVSDWSFTVADTSIQEDTSIPIDAMSSTNIKKKRKRGEKVSNETSNVQVMHNEVMAELKSMNANIGRMASALEIIASQREQSFP